VPGSGRPRVHIIVSPAFFALFLPLAVSRPECALAAQSSHAKSTHLPPIARACAPSHAVVRGCWLDLNLPMMAVGR
jgi:hypothetical protein